MSKILMTGGAIVGLIALGALVDACDDRPRPPLAHAFTTPTATSSTTTARPSEFPTEARRFYAKYKTMPNVSGWTLARVAKLFGPVRETVLVARTADNTLAVGLEKVTKQLPKQGAKLAAGQTVKIWITYGTKRPRSTYRPRVPDRDGNRDSHRDRGESRFCSGRWWC